MFKAVKNISQKLGSIVQNKELGGNIECKDRNIREKIKKQALPIIQTIQEKRKVLIKKIQLKFILEKDSGIFYFLGVCDDFPIVRADHVHPPHTLYQGTSGYLTQSDDKPKKEMPVLFHKQHFPLPQAHSSDPKKSSTNSSAKLQLKRYQCRGTFCQYRVNIYKSNPQHLCQWKQIIQNDVQGAQGSISNINETA